MSIRVMTATISAITIAAALTLNAQTPAPQSKPQVPPAQPQTDRPRPPVDMQGRTGADQAVTVTGCLMAEKDVPGRRESATARAGMGENYVLTNVKMSQSATTSGLGLAPMYQIKGGSLKESELKNHVGHQIEVMGRLESTGKAVPTENSNLPNFEATSVKMLSATCPAP